MTTTKQIAHLAGVSRGTVDRVLNKRGSVNPGTAAKVREIAEALNYTPNIAGKTLAVRKKQLKFGYILFGSTTSDLFFLDVMRGIETRAAELAEYGVRVVHHSVTVHEHGHEEMIRHIDDLVQNGVSGLILTAINHPDVTARVRTLAAAGIPVVTANSDLPDSGRIAYVGSDYFKSGETAAGIMNLVCSGNANVGVINGSPLVLCHSEREQGFRHRIRAAYPGINIVDSVINHDDDMESFIVTSRLLNDHPKIDALFLTAAGVTGACRAVADSGRKIRVVSNDATEPICALIKEGAIAASIAQQPFTQGAKPLSILFDYLGMGIKPDREFYYTKLEIKIRENL
jgi:LacI family transcriptional regulator